MCVEMYSSISIRIFISTNFYLLFLFLLKFLILVTQMFDQIPKLNSKKPTTILLQVYKLAQILLFLKQV